MVEKYAAIMTAFDENGFVDELGTRKIVRHAIDDMKVDGLFVNASIGENFLLGTPAKKNILQIVWNEAKDDNVDLIAQIGSPNFHESRDIAQYVTNDLGYKTVAAITPFYYHFTFDELKNYYEQLVNDIDTNLILYVSPQMTHVNLLISEYKELFKNSKIIGVDYEGTDMHLLAALCQEFPDKLIYTGDDENILPALSLGVDGLIEASFNVDGKRINEEISAFIASKMGKTTKLNEQHNALMNELDKNGIYQTMKLVLCKMGVPAGYNRIPLSKPTLNQNEAAKKIYQKYII